MKELLLWQDCYEMRQLSYYILSQHLYDKWMLMTAVKIFLRQIWAVLTLHLQFNVETFLIVVHLKIYTIYYNSNFFNTITLVNIPMHCNYVDNKAMFSQWQWNGWLWLKGISWTVTHNFHKMLILSGYHNCWECTISQWLPLHLSPGHWLHHVVPLHKTGAVVS